MAAATVSSVGILDGLRSLFAAAPPRLVSGPVEVSTPSAIPTKAEGLSGVANFSGRTTWEPIQELRDQAGFGRTGGEWGFWEDLSAANSFVAQALDHVCAPVEAARVDIEPIPVERIGTGPGQVSQAVADEMCELLRWNFTEALRLGSLNAIAARNFLKSGFALFEPVAAQDARGRWYVAKLAQRLPQSLHANPWLETDDATTLRAVRQQSTRGSRWETVELPAERVLLFIWERQGTNWAGRSAFRAVQYIAGHVMPMLLKLIGVTLQREGAGIPIVEGDKDAKLTAEQRDQLVELMDALVFHEGASAVLPAGWQLKWTFSGGANKGHVLEVWRELGIVVLQQLGAQQLALGTSNTGSRSVGEVHDARTAVKVQQILTVLEAVLNGDDGEPFQGLAPRICRWNWGPQAAYPRVKLTMLRGELPVGELATAASTAKAAGIFTPTYRDEVAFRSKAGLPPISEEEREEAKEAAAALAPQLPGMPSSPPKPEPEEGGDAEPKSGETELPEEEAKDAKKLAASAQRGGWVPWRPLRASEQRVPWEKRNAYFDAQRDAWEKALRPVVLAMLAKAMPAIAAAMADGTVKPAEVAAIPLDTKRLRAAVRKLLEGVRDAGAGSIEEELASRPLTAAAGDEAKEPAEQVEEETDELFDSLEQQVERRVVARARAELEREAIDALRTGDDAESVVDRVVSRQLDTGAFRADAGYVVTKAFNGARDEAARLMGGVAEVEYSAILDSASCSACQSLDGATAPFGSAEHDRLVPPNRDCSGGDNCRCLLVFVPAGADGGDE